MGDERSNVLRWRKRVRVIPESIRFKDPNITRTSDKNYIELFMRAFKSKLYIEKEAKKNQI